MNDRNDRERMDEGSQLSTQSSGNSPFVPLAQTGNSNEFELDPIVATRVATAIANATRSAERNRRSGSRWDQRTATVRDQGGPSGGGSGNNDSSVSQVNVSALLEAINANANRHRYYDGQVVNQRGGIDRIINDAVPQDYSERSDWIEKQELKLRTNGSGIRMIASDESMLSVRRGEPFTPANAMRRQFSSDKVFKFACVFDQQGEEQLFNLTDNTGVDCMVRIPNRIWLLLCEGVYSAILLNIPRELRFLHQNVAVNDAKSLLHNIRFMVNDISSTPIDLLQARLQKLSCSSLGEYQTVRSDLTALIRDWEDYRTRGSIEERDCKTTKDWKGIIANLFHDTCPGIRLYINSPDTARKRVNEVLAECDARVITRTQEALFQMENKGNISMPSVDNSASLYSRYDNNSSGSGAGWSSWKGKSSSAPVNYHYHNYGGKGSRSYTGKMEGDERNGYRKRKQSNWDWNESKFKKGKEGKGRNKSGKGTGNKGKGNKGKGNKGKGYGRNRDQHFQSYIAKCKEFYEQSGWQEDSQHEQVSGESQGERESEENQGDSYASVEETNEEHEDAENNGEYTDGEYADGDANDESQYDY